MKSLSFGAVIWDNAGEYKTLGGDALNFTVHLARQGAEAYFYTRVGTDQDGKETLRLMKEYGVHTDFVQVDPVHETGRADIVLDGEGVATYVFNQSASNEYIDVAQDEIDHIRQLDVDVFHFTSFCLDSEKSCDTLFRILDGCDFRLVFCDLNIRKGFREKAMIRRCMLASDILKLNEEEFELIRGIFYKGMKDEQEIVEKLLANFGIRVLCITKGAEGCKIYGGADGGIAIKGWIVETVDTVGAGDSFSSAFVAAYIQGLDLVECGKRGNALGGYVSSKRGALPPYDAWIKEVLEVKE